MLWDTLFAIPWVLVGELSYSKKRIETKFWPNHDSTFAVKWEKCLDDRITWVSDIGNQINFSRKGSRWYRGRCNIGKKNPLEIYSEISQNIIQSGLPRIPSSSKWNTCISRRTRRKQSSTLLSSGDVKQSSRPWNSLYRSILKKSWKCVYTWVCNVANRHWFSTNKDKEIPLYRV